MTGAVQSCSQWELAMRGMGSQTPIGAEELPDIPPAQELSAVDMAAACLCLADATCWHTAAWRRQADQTTPGGGSGPSCASSLSRG